MKKLWMSNMIRLTKNKVYVIGCLLAFLITYVWCAGVVDFLPVLEGEPMERMIMISGAMIFFFSLFVPMYISVEYTDGIIRNKIITGHSQRKIYLTDYLALVGGVICMTVCWFLAGALAGGVQDVRIVKTALLTVIYLSGYVAVLTTLAFRIKKQVVSIILSMVLFFFLFENMMVGNLMLSNMGLGLEAEARDAGLLVYNLNVVGQWFSDTHYSFGGMSIAPMARILLMAGLVAVAMIIGMMDLGKRDLK